MVSLTVWQRGREHRYLDMQSRLARGVDGYFELYAQVLGAIYVYISYYIIYNQ